MSGLVPGFGASASGVSAQERGLGPAPGGGALAQAPAIAPDEEAFRQEDREFAETLLMVLVQRRFLALHEQSSEMPPILGTTPSLARGQPREGLDRALPAGGLDLVRTELRAELARWERFAEGVVFQNDANLREALLGSFLAEMDSLMASPPGADVEAVDMVTVAIGVVGFALDRVLRGNFVSAALTTVASLIVNHVTDAMATREQAKRRRRLETILHRDTRLSRAWEQDVYQIDAIDDYYGLWLERVPAVDLLDFRLPIAPEVHPTSEWASALSAAVARKTREGVTATPPTPRRLGAQELLASLEAWGIALKQHTDLRKLLLGSPIRAFVTSRLRFPASALRPARTIVLEGDHVVVGLFPHEVDATRFAPDGIWVLHEPTAATFLFRFDDRLFHELPPRTSP